MDIKSTTSAELSGAVAEEVVTIVPDVDDTFIGYTTSVVDFINSAPWENIVSVLGNEDVVIRIKAFKKGTPIKPEVDARPESTGEGVPPEAPVAAPAEEPSEPEDSSGTVKGDLIASSRMVEASLLESALKGQTFRSYEQAVAFYSAVKRALDIVGAAPDRFTLIMADNNGAYTVKLSAIEAPLSDFIRRLSGLFPW